MLALDWSLSPLAGNAGKLQPLRLGLAFPLAQPKTSVQRAAPKRKGQTDMSYLIFSKSLIRLRWWEILEPPRKAKNVSQIKGTSVISKKHLLPNISSRDVNNKEVHHLVGEVRGWVEIRTTMASLNPDSFCPFSICGFGLQVWTIRIKKWGKDFQTNLGTQQYLGEGKRQESLLLCPFSLRRQCFSRYTPLNSPSDSN